MPAPRLKPFTVEMWRDGTCGVQDGHTDGWTAYETDPILESKPCLSTRSWLAEGDGNVAHLYVWTWARSEKHAVKIANDIRAQRIASGEWKP